MLLTGIQEVGQAIANGALGVIEAVKIGDVVVSALSGLSGGDSVEITDRAVQAGFLVTEGVVRNPKERTLDILLANPEISLEAGISAALTGSWAGFTETWRDKKESLYQLFDGYEIVEVVTHENRYPRMIIKSITPLFDSEENWDCFIASVVVREWDERATTTATGIDNAITSATESVGSL